MFPPELTDIAGPSSRAPAANREDVAAGTGGSDSIRVRFRIPYDTRLGQNVVVVGNTSSLGAWETSQGLRLEWQAGGVWTGTTDLSREEILQVEYVYCIVDNDPNIAVVWEYGEPRSLQANTAAQKTVTNGGHRITADEEVEELLDRQLVVPDQLQGRAVYAAIDCRDWWRPSQDYHHVYTRDMFVKTMMPPAPDNADDDFARVVPTGKAPVVRFNFLNARIASGHRVAVVGSIPELGEWDTANALLLHNREHPMWRAEVAIAAAMDDIEYKYIIVDENKECIQYESGDNRRLDMKTVDDNSLVVVSDMWFRYDTMFRTSGVAIPVFSLRTESSMGVGEFRDIEVLVDWCDKAGLKIIQLLPVNDTNSTGTWTDSYPYAPYTVFALHPLYASMDRVGNLSDPLMQEIMEGKGRELNSKDAVDYEAVLRLKLNWFKRAFHDNKDAFLASKEFRKFFKDNSEWLVPYAVFSYFKEHFQTCDFRQWGKYSSLREHDIWELADPSAPQYTDVARFYYIQYHCHVQLCEAIQYGRGKGISVKGDIPIGIYRFSVDAWMYPHLFDQSQQIGCVMDSQMGTPPDAFTEEGQNWQFPMYVWEEHVKEKFTWWRRRLYKMAEYYDLFRIDHVLGFFRLWAIDNGNVTGMMGHFEPNRPITLKEIQDRGISFELGRYCHPYIRDHVLARYFKPQDIEYIKSAYLRDAGDGLYAFKDHVNTQQKVDEVLPTVHDMTPTDFIRNMELKKALYKLHGEIIFHEKKGSQGQEFFPRFAPWLTQSFTDLDTHSKHMICEMFHDWQWVRNDALWAEKALEYLPRVEDATNMLVCAEDLGTVPISSPHVLDSLNITRLVIQRLPLAPGTEWWDLARTPYLAVVSPGTHDMPTIRQWWEQQRDKAERFFRYGLGHVHDEMPYFCEPWVVREIVEQHMASPSMLAIIPIQDLLGMDGKLRREDPDAEQINHCENLPYHYWRYRMHVPLETLLGKMGEPLTNDIRAMVHASGRASLY